MQDYKEKKLDSEEDRLDNEEDRLDIEKDRLDSKERTCLSVSSIVWTLQRTASQVRRIG